MSISSVIHLLFSIFCLSAAPSGSGIAQQLQGIFDDGVRAARLQLFPLPEAPESPHRESARAFACLHVRGRVPQIEDVRRRKLQPPQDPEHAVGAWLDGHALLLSLYHVEITLAVQSLDDVDRLGVGLVGEHRQLHLLGLQGCQELRNALIWPHLVHAVLPEYLPVQGIGLVKMRKLRVPGRSQGPLHQISRAVPHKIFILFQSKGTISKGLQGLVPTVLYAVYGIG